MRNLLTVAICGLLGAVASAQIDDDPLVQELKRSLAELGAGSTANADLERSRGGWARQRELIERAIDDQEVALAGSPAEVEKALTLYASRVGPRADAADHYLYGRILGLTGKLDAAYEQFKKALERDRFFYWGWDGIGVYHLNKGNFDLARQAFRAALKINPGYRKASFGLAESHIRENDFGQAALILNDILASEGKTVDPAVEQQARLNLAEVYRRQGEYARSIDELSWLVEHGLDDVGVLMARAWNARKLERWADAARDYRSLTELVPKDFRHDFELAQCLARLGRNAEAAEAIRSGLKKSEGRLDVTHREALERERDRLEKLPAEQSPESRKLTFNDFLAHLTDSADVQRRRQAVLTLSNVTTDQVPNDAVYLKLLAAFTKAISDRDDIVAAKALQQVVERLPNSEQVLAILDACLVHPSPKVRGMAASLYRYYPETEIVPRLVFALRDEKDPYAFRQMHERLSSKSLAFVERVLPDTLTAESMAGVRTAWDAWYEKRRDIYRKHEPKADRGNY